MAEYLIQGESLTAIADAIRANTGETASLSLAAMAEAITTLDGTNFKIVGGTTEPTSPSENMIWVNTDTAITDWAFSSTQPAAVTGRVWFQTGTVSPIAFNALSQNILQIYPTLVRQYINGSWVTKIAKSYINGTWVNTVADITVFSGGDNTDVTGGWVTLGSVLTWTNNSSELWLEAQSGAAHAAAVTNKAIDLTNYSKIEFTCNRVAGNQGRYYISTGKNYSMAAYVAVTAAGTYSIDVTNLSGSYYIGLYTNSYNELGCSKIVVKT